MLVLTCPEEVVEIVEAGEQEEPQADEEEVVEEGVGAGNQTRSGRIVNTRFIEEMNAIASDYQIKFSKSEEHYNEAMLKIGTLQSEFGCAGAGLGGGFINTSELHVMKYNQAMATPEAKQWEESVEQEHKRMTDYNVWKAVLRSTIPEGAKVLTSTWAIKKSQMASSVLG